MELTQKKESSICLSCGECCKRYSIVLMPSEILKISKKLKISQKEFLEKYCELFVKIYPKSIPGLLTFSTAFFPKRIGKLLYTHFDYLPTSFFVLPQVALKRKDGICRFLDKDNACKIYLERPEPCKIFPFMVVSGYEEQYPFCGLFKKTTKDYLKQSKKYAKKTRDYFKDVDNRGFEKVWKNSPKQGKLFLTDSLIGGITKKQLLKMIEVKA